MEEMVSILVGPSLRRRLTLLRRNIERGMAAEGRERESEREREREGEK